MRIIQDPPAIIEIAEHRDRKACIALARKVDGANRELAQWLLMNPRYTAVDVAKWMKEDEVAGYGERKIAALRAWAVKGFGGLPFDKSNQPRGDRAQAPAGGPLKTDDNFEDDDFEVNNEEVQDPAHILKHALDSINQAKAVAEAYRKIFKRSAFDREAKAKIYNAIRHLIMKWRTVQSTLERKGQGNGQNEND